MTEHSDDGTPAPRWPRIGDGTPRALALYLQRQGRALRDRQDAEPAPVVDLARQTDGAEYGQGFAAGLQHRGREIRARVSEYGRPALAVDAENDAADRQARTSESD